MLDKDSFEETDMFVVHRIRDFGMDGKTIPGDGVVTGSGKVNGKLIYVYAQDFTVFGGSLSSDHAKKIVKIMKLAIQNKAPIIGLNDSGGARIQEGVESLGGYADVFLQNALASGVVPQISMIMGPCAGGAVYSPAMTDFTFMVKDTSYMFVTGPDVVKTVTSEEVTAEELGGADVHTAQSGVADHFAEDEPEALRMVRNIVENIGTRELAPFDRIETEDPFYDADELLGLIPEDNRTPVDVKELIARIVDGSRFHEFKSRYGQTLICGFAHIHGYKVGIVANNGILFSESSLKGAHFVELCGQRGIPLVFLQNITGFMVGKDYEAGGIAKDGAKLVTAVSCVNVPKFTVIVGGSHGAGNYGMCGRAYDPRFLFMWPNSRISVMGGPQAADVLTTVKQDQRIREGKDPMEGEELDSFRAPILEKYETEGSPYYSTARLWDDLSLIHI